MANYTVNNFELDDNQMKIINNDCNSIVIAGAGSGKTLTITGKVNYLLENNIVKPEEILIISFTNASVNDIKQKVNKKINVFTFHKLAMFLLNNTNDINYHICSNNYLKYIIKESLQTCDKKTQKTILKFLKLDYNYNCFLKSKVFDSFSNLAEKFINLWKTNNYKYDPKMLKRFSLLEKNILVFFFTIYKKYNEEKISTNRIDFDDLIILATKVVFKTNLNFKYIIIDEFQDTSLIRLNLIKEIYKYTNSKIIVVGDDWQSIYRFSGCDLSIFLNFSKSFPDVNTIKLINTYRNSQELISIASSFIEKNPFQITKELFSSKHEIDPLIFVPYDNKIVILKKLLNYTFKLSNNIMILIRNNKDILEYIDEEYSLKDNILHFNNREVKLYTVHKSKGLEADYVIILNINNERLGFPNKIENNVLIEKINFHKEIKYAEERRLFYVAITRCKKKTFLVYDKKSPSCFIKETKKIVKKKLKHIKYFN